MLLALSATLLILEYISDVGPIEGKHDLLIAQNWGMTITERTLMHPKMVIDSARNPPMFGLDQCSLKERSQKNIRV